MTRLELEGKYDKNKAWNERNKERVALNKKRYRQTEEYKKSQRKSQAKYVLKNKEKVRGKQRVYQRNYVDTFHSGYVLSRLCIGKKHLRHTLKQHPEIIECERVRLMLQRAIKVINK